MRTEENIQRKTICFHLHLQFVQYHTDCAIFHQMVTGKRIQDIVLVDTILKNSWSFISCMVKIHNFKGFKSPLLMCQGETIMYVKLLNWTFSLFLFKVEKRLERKEIKTLFPWSTPSNGPLPFYSKVFHLKYLYEMLHKVAPNYDLFDHDVSPFRAPPSLL